MSWKAARQWEHTAWEKLNTVLDHLRTIGCTKSGNSELALQCTNSFLRRVGEQLYGAKEVWWKRLLGKGSVSREEEAEANQGGEFLRRPLRGSLVFEIGDRIGLVVHRLDVVWRTSEDILASALVASLRDVMQRGSVPSLLVEGWSTRLGRGQRIGWWRWMMNEGWCSWRLQFVVVAQLERQALGGGRQEGKGDADQTVSLWRWI